MLHPEHKKVAIISKFSAYGGISRMMANLASGLVDQGVDVDLIIAGGNVPFPETLDSRINTVHFHVEHVYSALLPLVKYLNIVSPDVVLATRHKNMTISLLAHLLASGRSHRKLCLRLSGNLSSSIAGKSLPGQWLHNLPIRFLYQKADKVIAVSQGVAEDFCRLTRAPATAATVVHNPTISKELFQLSRHSVDHPWFKHRDLPIVLGVGRFTKRKDFATLIRAFSILRHHQPCRLVLLGEGEEREAYLNLAHELGINQDMSLPGFTPNPYAYMARSNVLALTSKAAEGSPNVLKEALALGLPVVSTDCPSGPREILKDGAYGRLVPMEDPHAMAIALKETLSHTPDPDFLKSAVTQYTVQSSTLEYMKAFGF